MAETRHRGDNEHTDYEWRVLLVYELEDRCTGTNDFWFGNEKAARELFRRLQTGHHAKKVSLFKRPDVALEEVDEWRRDG